jgi:16S rRNA (cytosine967-C5)-methyltransferase
VASISVARKAAFEILLALERQRGHSDELLRGAGKSLLAEADRNLATMLVLGVLRWQIRLDDRIRHLLKRPNARLDDQVLIALRLGAFQLLFLDRVPAHAAIDESVELAKRAGHHFAAGMVNAVLRRVAGSPKREEVAGDKAKDLALTHAHPAWMVERWVNFYGVEAASKICRQGQMQAPMSLRVESGSNDGEFAKAGVVVEPGSLLSNARVVVSGTVTGTEAFQSGRARIQDEGSQFIGELAAALSSGQEPKEVLDLCAAPGGKTLILAERNAQAHILACEASLRRVAELRERLAAHAGHVECRHADATALRDECAFDVVLADVPCSGTGTLGRNPEIRHHLKLEDLARQAERQRAILRVALRAVRPGGSIVYSTCSLEPEENEQVVAAVLSQVPEARQVCLEPQIATLEREGTLTPGGARGLRACLTPQGALRLLPGAVATDGFFVALIEKTA